MGWLKAQATSSPKQRWLLGAIAVGVIALAAGIFQVSVSSRSLAPAEEQRTAKSSQAAQTTTQEPVRRVQVTRVTSGPVGALATYPGTAKAAQVASLAFRVGGPLVEVNIKPGDKVKRGDVLMRIDPRDFESAVKAAQAALDSANAKLLVMKRGARKEDLMVLDAKLDAAEARRQFLQGVFDRNKRMIESNAVSRQQYDNSESDLLAILADIRALEQELQKAKTGARAEDIQAMEAEIRGLQTSLKIAQDRLEDTSLRAPFDGLITKQLAENYEQVSPGQNVLAMHDVSTIEIDVDLPEKEILYRALDKPFNVAVRFVSIEDRQFEAKFKEVDTEADPSTRTYTVTFVMQAPKDVNILPGMIADVSVQSRTSQAINGHKPTVPAAAVQSDQNGGRFVWVVSGNGAVERRPVVVGSLSESNNYEVKGVAEGEPVVTAGAAYLYDGAKVVVSNDASLGQKERLTQVAPSDRVN